MSDPTITLAKAPFDNPNADLILRSSDNVDFRVIKSFLSFSSSVFQDMFTLPQPAINSGGSNDQKDNLPVVPLTEPGKVVEKLLMYCYPKWGAEPVLETLEDVQSVLDAADKYNMDGVKAHIGEILMAPRFMQNEVGHLRVFGIAFRYGLKEVAMEAMRNTRNYPVLGREYVKELDHVPCKAHHQLLDYHWRCSIDVVGPATVFTWLPTVEQRWDRPVKFIVPAIPECQTCRGSDSESLEFQNHIIFPSKCWTTYVEKVREALKTRPCSASVLRCDLADRAMEDAGRCGKCNSYAIGKMKSFIELFAKEIDRVTSEVSFHDRPFS
jgi:hypothetical protein